MTDLAFQVDLWNGPDGEPVIYHGHTLTSKLPVRDALEAIAKYAFVASPYPLILSLEVHCDQAQQDKVAELLAHYCGPALVTQQLSDLEADVLPSPDQLKNRFLVKAKNLMLSKEGKKDGSQMVLDSESTEMSSSATVSESSENELSKRISRVLGRETSPKKKPPPLGHSSTPSMSSNSGKAQPDKKEKTPMSLQLAALLVYTIGVKSRGINKKESYHPFHLLSLSEKRLGQMIKEAATDLVDHTREHLIRAYPYGMRLTSSNYNPVDAWAMGAQLVAMNYQTAGETPLHSSNRFSICSLDSGHQLNSAMFQQNGACGFIIKPDYLRRKDPISKDKEIFATPACYQIDIKVCACSVSINDLRLNEWTL